MFTPAMAASRVSSPFCSISIARAQARKPFSLEMAIFFGAAALNCTAAAVATSRFRLVMIVLAILLLSLRENASGYLRIGAAHCRFHCGRQEKETSRY